ncbi:MAG: hypothetical protein ACTSVI_00280 [Promethearchaeota archaeon]
MNPEMLISPKKIMKNYEESRTIKALEVNYDDVKREDVKNGFISIKKAIIINTIFIIVISTNIIFEILLNINLGDNIFPEGHVASGMFIIPWLEWHEWLESLSWTLGIISAVLISLVVGNIIIHLHYKMTIPDVKLDEKLSAISKAELDIKTRLNFKKKYADVYEDLKKGKLRIEKTVKAATTVAKGGLSLPKIKMPPKVSIAPPGAMKIPQISMKAPPIPGLGVKKKKPSGPITGEKKIFVRCERCNKTLHVSIPKKLVLDNELEVVPISIIHGEKGNEHVLTVFLDPDFKSRRDRVSDVLYLGE